jgi:hypothetical protein
VSCNCISLRTDDVEIDTGTDETDTGTDTDDTVQLMILFS